MLRRSWKFHLVAGIFAEPAPAVGHARSHVRGSRRAREADAAPPGPIVKQ
jgi:hypothetical protein